MHVVGMGPTSWGHASSSCSWPSLITCEVGDELQTPAPTSGFVCFALPLRRASDLTLLWNSSLKLCLCVLAHAVVGMDSLESIFEFSWVCCQLFRPQAVPSETDG
mmetsp:Transcript_57285/g.152795  ORF Transcript_57285/g.152795 Transcript_57285/m.152795 type:complete len:105 (+) Transcript_57285:2060-2374(+)